MMLEKSISVKNLRMIYNYYEKQQGIKGSLKNWFGRKCLQKVALDDVNIEIKQGSIVGYVGLNGAGKTTTMKILSGILNPTEGQVEVLGYNPYKKEKEYLKQIGIVMGNKSQLMWDLPAIDSIELNRVIYGVPDDEYKEIFDEMVKLLNVEKLLNIQVRRLSLGERMKMELIAALIHSPKVVFLDEPTIGLDIISQNNIREFLKYYNREKKATIIMTSHNFDDISEVCNELLLLDKGKIIFTGPLKEFYNQYSNSKNIKIKLRNKNERFYKTLLSNIDENKIEFDEINNEFNIKVGNNVLLEVIYKTVEKYIEEIVDISIQNIELKDIITEMFK